MKKVHLSVTNDLYTDQRINKMAQTLSVMGFQVNITGVMRPDSKVFSPPRVGARRMRLLFQKGFLFYAEYNIRLFFLLLSGHYDLYIANDLDTLLPNFLIARLKRTPLVYDSHEYFTGSPEIRDRPFVKWFWKTLEKKLVPRQKLMITVNTSIARLYEKEYGLKAYVVRNLPRYRHPTSRIPGDELSLPPHKDIVLLQGSGINMERGAEELLMAMHPRHGLTQVLLLIIGSGDVLPKLKEMANSAQLGDRVMFLDKMHPDLLHEYTSHASIGVSLDRGDSLNYRYSLPNKLFDYIMAGTPQLVSDLPEVASIVKKYQTGLVVKSHDPALIAASISDMLKDGERLRTWRQNALEAARELCWEKEEVIVKEVFERFLR